MIKTRLQWAQGDKILGQNLIEQEFTLVESRLMEIPFSQYRLNYLLRCLLYEVVRLNRLVDSDEVATTVDIRIEGIDI